MVREARAAGARSIWANVVYLRPGTREHFLEALAEDWPEEAARYEQLFANRAYLPAAVTDPIKEHVREAARAAPLRHRPSPRRERAASATRQLKLVV